MYQVCSIFRVILCVLNLPALIQGLIGSNGHSDLITHSTVTRQELESHKNYVFEGYSIYHQLIQVH